VSLDDASRCEPSSQLSSTRAIPSARAITRPLPEDLAGEAPAALSGTDAVADVATLGEQKIVELVADRDSADQHSTTERAQEGGWHPTLG